MLNLLSNTRAQVVQKYLLACVFVGRFILTRARPIANMCSKPQFINFLYALSNRVIAQTYFSYNRVRGLVLHTIHRPYKSYNEVYKGVLV